MARTVGSYGPATMEAIRDAGLKLIYKHGYEAMSLRNLASEVGIQVGSLYNHIPNKQFLLFDLMQSHMTKLIENMHLTLDGINGPEERLRSFIRFHLKYHFNCKMDVYIAYSELRSLEKNNYITIAKLRREYEHYLINIINDGLLDNIFSVDNAKVAAYAIISQLTSVLMWYHVNGQMTFEELVSLNTKMVFGALGVQLRLF